MDDPNEVLGDEERRRLRAEARLLVLAANEAKPPEVPKSRMERLLGYLSNGFVLLLLGSVITSVLVPWFQRGIERRKEQVALVQECLSHFFVYSNSLRLEMNTLVPLTQKSHIDEQTYLHHLQQIATLQQKRSDAIAKARALAAVFDIDDRHSGGGALGKELDGFTRSLDQTGKAVEQWLHGLYCTPDDRKPPVDDKPKCAEFDLAFDAHAAYLRLEAQVAEVSGARAQSIADGIAARIHRRGGEP